MSSDLDDFEEQIQELIKSIQVVLDTELPKLKGQAKVEKCQYLRNRVTRAKQVHRSIIVEVRSLEGTVKNEWEAKARGFDDKLAKLSQDIDWAESSNQGNEDLEDMTAIDMTKHALVVQDKTQESTSRAKKALEETIQIGATVNAEVKKQGEQILKIEEGIEQVETNMTRADKQVRIFIRRLATDKIFILLILFVVVGVILAIAFSVLKKKALYCGNMISYVSLGMFSIVREFIQ